MSCPDRLARRFAAAFAMLALAGSVAAQAPVRPLPDLDLRGLGLPAVGARHADGRLVVGGGFTRVGDLPVRFIARFAADGTPDPAFQPPLRAQVDDLEIDAQGRVYAILRPAAAADLQGQPLVVRLLDDASGSIDPSFQFEPPPGAESAGFALLVDDAGGALYAAFRRSGFTDYVVSRHALASGARDPAFNLTTNGLVFDLARSGPHLLVAGGFTQVNAVARRSVVRVDPATGALDETWNPGATGAGTGAQTVRALLVDGASHVFAAGVFSGVGATTSRGLARLSLVDGSADPAWLTPVLGSLSALAFDASGRLLAAGSPTQLGGSPWTSALTRFNADGTHDGAFGDPADRRGSTVDFLFPQADGSVHTAMYALGDDPPRLARYAATDGQRSALGTARFTGVPQVFRLLPDATRASYTAVLSYGVIDGAASLGAVRLGADLRPLPGWRSTLGPTVNFISMRDGALSSAHVYLAGSYFGPLPRPALRRLAAADGALDGGWLPTLPAPNSPTSNAVAVDEAGGFAYVAGGGGFNLARFALATGARDATWNPVIVGSQVARLHVEGGMLYAGGGFTTVGGLALPRLARIPLAGNGAPDAGWAPAPAAAAMFELDPAAGWVYVSGSDAAGNAVLRRHRLDSGAIDPLWAPLQGRVGSVDRFDLDPARGELVAVGRIAAGCDGRALPAVRLVGDARRVDATWSVGLDVAGFLADAALLPDGDALLAGAFERINGQARASIAALGAGDTLFADDNGDAGGCVR